MATTTMTQFPAPGGHTVTLTIRTRLGKGTAVSWECTCRAKGARDADGQPLTDITGAQHAQDHAATCEDGLARDDERANNQPVRWEW
jgi:hypothetical protein